MQIQITACTQTDCQMLTEIAMSAKAFWGYSEAFMDAVFIELSVTPTKLASPSSMYFKATLEDQLCGFYCIELHDQNSAELDALFVSPDWIGRGIGKQLFQHACELLGSRNITRLFVQSDPNALGFYQKTGCRLLAEKSSGSIPGRMLPWLVYEMTRNKPAMQDYSIESTNNSVLK